MASPQAEYVKIVEEMFEKKKEFWLIGQYIQRWDALSKMLGKAKFTADYAYLFKNLV